MWLIMENRILWIGIDEMMVNGVYSIHLLLHIYHKILLKMNIVYLLIEWCHVYIFLFILAIIASSEKLRAIVHVFDDLLMKVSLWLGGILRILIWKRILVSFWKIIVRLQVSILACYVIIHLTILPSIIWFTWMLVLITCL